MDKKVTPLLILLFFLISIYLYLPEEETNTPEKINNIQNFENTDISTTTQDNN